LSSKENIPTTSTPSVPCFSCGRIIFPSLELAVWPEELPTEMSSRPILIPGIVGGILAGVALFSLALAVVAIDGAAVSGQMMAMIVLGAMLGFVLDATWLTLAMEPALEAWPW
jgi:hypothetical protein